MANQVNDVNDQVVPAGVNDIIVEYDSRNIGTPDSEVVSFLILQIHKLLFIFLFLFFSIFL